MGAPIGNIIASMRPHQWIKNFFIVAALIFSGHLFVLEDVVATIAGFFCFSIVASSIYLFNDIKDVENDRLHPEKSQRPLPSGKLSIGAARSGFIVLGIAGLSASYALHVGFFLLTLFYFVINIAYSIWLKDVVILDVMTISAGFVIRVAAGAVLINVPTSEWLIICTVLLALFLGFSKRRYEMTVLESRAGDHRSVLRHYSPYFLDQMIGIVTASTVMSYALYTISEETVRKFGTTHLIYTVPFVLYGIFRYLYLVHKKEEGGNPTRLAVTDVPLLVNIILWIVTASLIIYRHW
jgi:4-hydroxybenzoate polyprenyltransferase